MAFSAGSIVGGLELDTTRFEAGIHRATSLGERFAQRMERESSQFRLAGQETVSAFRRVIDTAHREAQRFAANKDVLFVADVVGEAIDESVRRVRSQAQRLADRLGLTLAVQATIDKGSAGLAAVRELPRRISRAMRPVTIRVELARRAMDQAIEQTRSRLMSLQRFRAVRIGIAAISTVPPVARAAMAAVAPLTRLARSGVRLAITATAAGLARAVGAARGMLSSFASFAGRILRSPLVLLGGFVGAAASVVTAIRRVQSTMGQIDTVAKFSDRIGIATDKLVALRYAGEQTGMAAGQLDMGLQRMTRRIAAASQGAGEAVPALRALGLDAQAMAARSPDEQFLAIADAMEGIESQSERVRLAFALFDSEGVGLVNTMRGGAEAVRAAMEENEALGNSLTRIDAAKVELANDAFTRIGKVINGIWQSIAVNLSPYIQGVADLFVNAAKEGGGFGGVVSNAVEWVAKAIAYASDYLKLFAAGWQMLRAGVITAGAGVVKVIDLIGANVVRVLNLIPGVNTEWADTLGRMATDMMHQAGEAVREAGAAFDDFRSGANQARVTEFFDTARRKSQEAAEAIARNAQNAGGSLDKLGEEALRQQLKITEALDGIAKEIEQFGMSDMEIRLAEFRGMEGVTAEQAAQFEQSLRRLEGLRVGKEMEEEAKRAREQLEEAGRRLAEQLRTPMEAYEARISELDKLRQAGVIDAEIYARAVRKARSELESPDAGPTRLTGLVAAGSQEAFRLRAEIEQGRDHDRIPRDQLAEMRRTADGVEELSRRLNFTVG